jgi:RNase P protein component
VRRSGARIRVDFLDVRAATSARPKPRVGFVVAKYSHTAVERNRLKRRLRELVRTRLMPVLRVGAATGESEGEGEGEGEREQKGRRRGVASIDVVVRALPAAYGVSYAVLAEQVDRVCADVRRRAAASDR